MKFKKYLLLAPILFSSFIGMAQATFSTNERDALIALYNSTDGDNWDNNTGWLGVIGTECNWYGVTCNDNKTSVTVLSLGTNKLTGSIPVELEQLTSLTWLDLSNNNLKGIIPVELRQLNLTVLYLRYNQLTGSIPFELSEITLFLDPINRYDPTNVPTPESYTVNVSAGLGGSISPNNELSVNEGQTQLFEITKNIGYAINSVSGCGGSLNANIYTTGAINASCTVIATFTANAVNGECGDSNGQTLTVQPSVNLCVSGTSSVISGSNPWLWNCNGSNGGSAASCATVKSFVDSTPEDSVVTEGDSDGDGLSNQQEAELGTNPNHSDSDGDGIPDGWEAQYGLDPTLNDASLDSDKDGLTNLEEFHANQNPNEANLDPAAKVFKQHGHGSVIAYYGQTELSNSNRYGISKDDIQLHADGSIPVAMVQWQTDTSSCSKLKLSMEDSRLANVHITYGAWDNREDDMIFTDVHLPFVIGAENTQDTDFADGSWRVLSVGFDRALNSEATLKVECSSDLVTNATAVQTTQLIALENNQQWQGTGSIISAEYSSTGTANPYGILRDEVVLKPVGEGKVNGNPSVFFQWQGSQYCRAIELNTTVDGVSQTNTAILGVKNWNAETYQTEQITFPYRLEQPVTDDGGLQDWSLLQLDFQAVEQDTKVTAHCLQNSSHYTWSGNGSVISHTGITYLGNTVDQYGVNKDSVSIHANTSYPPVGFFQWQIDTNQCSSLTFDVDNETVRNNATINITYGAWSQREDDKVFKQVRLPFTVNASNMGETHADGNWRVFAVAFNEIQSVSTNLNAHCSNNVGSSASPVAGEAIVLENGSIWSGTGSIIRSEFASHIGSETPYGVTRDVSKIHSGKNNSVLLQWQPSDQCTQLQIAADSTSTKQDFAVSWGMKAWNAEEYEMISSQLPLTIDRGDSSWNLIRLDFSGDVTEATQIKADCL